MATVGTHMNWGASYVINDFYRPLWPGKSERQILYGNASKDDEDLVVTFARH